MNITDIKVIDARMMHRMIANSAATIENNCTKLNDLNVFPVPDGDTGSNMALTVSAAAHELAKGSRATAGEVADVSAKAMLRGARGNSGVITSLLFRGIAVELSGLDTCDAEALSKALQSGVAAAYKAVANPAEGTILTVSRLAADAAVKAADTGSVLSVIDAAIEAAKIALEQAEASLKEAGKDIRNEAVVLGSDGFFPFDDTVTLAAEYGVKAIVQPGGSVRDEDSVKKADEYGITMLCTGMRHFKH